MFEAESGSDFMVVEIVSHVVTNVPNGIVNGVVPCEELVTESDIVICTVSICSAINSLLTTIENIDEWELSRVCVSQVVELRVSSEKLIREILCQTAIEVERERMHEVINGIH